MHCKAMAAAGIKHITMHQKSEGETLQCFWGVLVVLLRVEKQQHYGHSLDTALARDESLSSEFGTVTLARSERFEWENASRAVQCSESATGAQLPLSSTSGSDLTVL